MREFTVPILRVLAVLLLGGVCGENQLLIIDCQYLGSSARMDARGRIPGLGQKGFNYPPGISRFVMSRFIFVFGNGQWDCVG